MYKAKILNGKLVVEEVIGYANDDGSLTIQTCGIYKRRLDFDGDMFEGAIGSTLYIDKVRVICTHEE